MGSREIEARIIEIMDEIVTFIKRICFVKE